MMQTLDFFKVVLPPDGPYHLSWALPNNKDFAGTTFVDSLEELADEALKIDAQGYTVYYRTANYLRRRGTSGANNAKARRSYHIDIDVGGNKAYATRKEAVVALASAIKTIGLPSPLIVSSGVGFHVYWVLTETVAKDVWLPTAKELKSRLKDAGLRVDAGLTGNVVCLLRPVGTHHRKSDTPIPVKVVRDTYAPISQENFASILGVAQDPLSGASELANMFAPSTDLVVEREYAPSDADAVAAHCNYIREFKETGFGGGGLQGEWYYAMGAIKGCVDGEAKCHEFSSHADNYSPDVTQTKLDDWGDRGPTTCEYVSDNFDYCGECPHKGSVTSPIQLGEKAAAIEELKSMGTDVDGPWWPKHVGWDDVKHQMYVEKYDDEDGWVKQYFSTSKFYVETRIWTDEGDWAFRVHRLKYVRDGQEIWDPFNVETKLVARPTDLAAEFARKEVYVNTRNGSNHISDVLKIYGDALRQRQVETVTHSAMGWYSKDDTLDKHDPLYPLHADGFILGNKLITADGDEEVLLSDKVAPEWRRGFGSSGTAKEWAQNVHKYYVKNDAVPYQFIVLTEFAAPLVSLFCRSEYHGTPIIISGESGWAKTSVCQIASSIWGNPSLLVVSGNPKAGSTALSFMSTLSSLRHISVLLDEVTKQQPHVLGELVYAIAMGKAKGRLKRDGTQMAVPSPWASLTKITSNNPVMQKVLDDDTDSAEAGDALQKRIFEINFERLPYTRDDYLADSDMGERVQASISTQFGTVGPIWIRYILQNLDDIVADLEAALTKCKRRSVDAAAERFHDYLEAAVMTAAKHVSKASLMFPNVRGVETFIGEVRADMSAVREDTKVPMLDAFARYLAQNQGGLLVTDRFHMGKGRPDTQEYPKQDLRGELIGRLALKDHIALLSVDPIKVWCKKRSLDFNKMLLELDNAGYLSHDPALMKGNSGKASPLRTATKRVSLANGTPVMSSREQCLSMDFGRLANKTNLRAVNTHVVDAEEGNAEKADT